MNPRRFPIWPAFDQGDVSPLADGRVDTAGYIRSCDKIENMVVRIQGPAERRPGSYYVGAAADNSIASRLIPFKYSADITFCLELGHNVMRFFYLGSRIVESELMTNGDMELDSDWSDYGSPSSNIQTSDQYHDGDYSRLFTISAAEDGIYGDTFTTTVGEHIVSLFVYSEESFVNVKVRAGDDSGWNVDQDFTIVPEVWHWIHFTYTEAAAGSGAYVVVAAPSSLSSGSWYVDDVSVRKIYEIETPWGYADLSALKYRQVANAMYFNHPDYPKRKLFRNATTDWSLSEVDFAWGPFLDENTTSTTIAPSATTGSSITLTASDTLFEDGHVGAFFKLVHDVIVSDEFTADATGSAVELEAGENFIISLSGTWSGTMYLTRSYDGGSTWVDYAYYTVNASVELVNLEDDVQWCWEMRSFSSGTCTARITQKDKAGYAQITAVASETSATADVIEDFFSTDATESWSEGAFSELRGYPRALSFYEGRMLDASTEYRPATVYGSKVDDYESHESGTDDDDAYAYTLAGAEVNKIAWMLDGDILHIGTTGEEWRFGDSDNATTPTYVNARKQTGWGSVETIDAVKAGDTVVFVEDGGRSMRAIFYNYERDTYVAEALSDKAEHLFKDSTISGLAFTARPVPMVWMWMADGSMRAATFDLQNKIVAFHRHTIGGDGVVESMCVIRGSYYDEVWILVRRTIDGATARYIEQIQPRTWTEKEDAFYVDGGLSFYASTPTKYFTGLYHLEGEQVQVLADGAVHAPVTVSDFSGDMRDNISEGMKEHRARKAFIQKWEEDDLRGRLKVRDMGRQRFVSRSRASTDAELQKLSDILIRTGDLDSISKGQAIIDGKVAAGIFTAEEGRQIGERFRKNAVVGYYERLIETPKTAPIAYQELISGPEKLNFVDERTKSALVEKARRAAEKQTENAYEMAVLNDVRTKFNEEPLAAMKHLEDPNNYKPLSFEGRTRLISYLSAMDTRKRLQKAAAVKAQAEADRSAIFASVLKNDLDKAIMQTAMSQAIDAKEKMSLYEKIRGYPWKTSPAVYADTVTKIHTGLITEPDQVDRLRGAGLSNEDADKLKGKLDQPKYKEAVDYAEKAFKLLYPAKDDLDKHMRYVAFAQQVEADISSQNAERAKANRPPLSAKEAREIVDGYLQETTRERKWWFDENYRPVERWMEGKPAFDTESKEDKKVRPQIPAVERARMTYIPRQTQEKIADILFEGGYKVNAQNIMHFYKQNMAQKGK